MRNRKHFCQNASHLGQTIQLYTDVIMAYPLSNSQLYTVFSSIWQWDVCLFISSGVASRRQQAHAPTSRARERNERPSPSAAEGGAFALIRLRIAPAFPLYAAFLGSFGTPSLPNSLFAFRLSLRGRLVLCILLGHSRRNRRTISTSDLPDYAHRRRPHP